MHLGLELALAIDHKRIKIVRILVAGQDPTIAVCGFWSDGQRCFQAKDSRWVHTQGAPCHLAGPNIQPVDTFGWHNIHPPTIRLFIQRQQTGLIRKVLIDTSAARQFFNRYAGPRARKQFENILAHGLPIGGRVKRAGRD